MGPQAQQLLDIARQAGEAILAVYHQDFAVPHHNGPHGHLAFFIGCLGLLQGLFHKIGMVKGEFHAPKNTILGKSCLLFEF